MLTFMPVGWGFGGFTSIDVVTKRSSDATWNTPAQAVGLLLRGHTLRTAVPTALVVGTILCAVNQGAILINDQATTGTWIRIAVNYAVPFLVASVGYLGARRHAQHHDHSPDASDQGD